MNFISVWLLFLQKNLLLTILDLYYVHLSLIMIKKIELDPSKKKNTKDYIYFKYIFVIICL